MTAKMKKGIRQELENLSKTRLKHLRADLNAELKLGETDSLSRTIDCYNTNCKECIIKGVCNYTSKATEDEWEDRTKWILAEIKKELAKR